MIVQLTRFVFFIGGVMGGYAVSRTADWAEQLDGLPQEFVIILFIILGASIGFVFGGMIGRELTLMYERAEERFGDVRFSDLILGSVGLLVGLLIAVLVSYPLRLVEPHVLAFLASVMIFGVVGYGGLRLFLTKRNDFARLFSRLEPQAADDSLAPAASTPTLLDTSAVIDGRFVELLHDGFLDPPLRVPGFVLFELQTLADSADDLKRARGRRGLDLLQTTRNEDAIEVFDADYPDIKDVDSKLVKLATDTGGRLVTVDFNLTKVARLAGARVVNLNELSVALRPHILPGEMLRLHVSREGKEPDQGVGYLEDGTMVVISNARAAVGTEVSAEVTSVLQTSAGRMVFTRLREAV